MPEIIVLKDLTFGMENPSMLDLKIGRPINKKPRKVEKYKTSTTFSHGFRIAGFKTYHPAT